jgi:cytochrome c oxidase subunit 3
MSQFHPHHLTLNSPWPVLTANATLSIIIGAVFWFNGIINGGNMFIIGLICTIFAFILWFRDIIIEGSFLGHHTRIVQAGLSIGVSLFIVTEAFFFLSIFWAYFHSSLAPQCEIGTQ